MSLPDISHLAAALEKDVHELCRPEGRMVGTEGHAVAERFVARRMEEIGLVPYRGDSFALPYEWEGIAFTNFVGVVPGRDRSLAPLLIGAHYDSVIEAPCADDNGAAVAICLALAEAAMKQGGYGRDLVVAIFDAEEPPYFQGPPMGSIRFATDELDDRGVHLAVIYDLVGHDVQVPFLKDLLFVTGAESHPDLPDLLGTTSLPAKLRLIAALNRYVGDMSDHGIFRKNRVPYLFFSCGRWQHYHRPSDTPDRLNYKKMARITQLSADVLERADAAGLGAFTGMPDTVAFEASTFRRSLGIALPLLCRWAGVEDLDSREAIDAVAAKLLSTGL
ncbi:M28 family peptidase [Luteolibacter flavescens]|uniref:M28 family peptidase n=1 Tax=Luteolibacter flavescens TaxID=1859460 RepID=A0ABT3FM94_9BACT|nr:M28 family peptidase [Luteolibacter flavescens]MCW1884095.1 M28 family peptidase [Luteolibacter flavescens]